MRDRVSCGKVKLSHQLIPEGDHIPHEQEYNTRYGLSAILYEVCREIRREPCQLKVQQEPAVYLFLEAALERECSFPRLPFRRPHSHPSQHTEAELKLIRDMRRRNPELGMIELWHREDQKRFYSCRAFYSLDDFAKQLAVHNRRSNNAPMRPLRWMSPTELTVQYV